MKASDCLFGAVMYCFLASGSALAQSVEDSRVQRLEDTIRNLELRIAYLESQLAGKTTPAKDPSDTTSWRKLRVDMSEIEVVKLLGAPSKVNDRDTYFNWLYGSPASAFVRFDASTRTVKTWSQP